MKSSSPILVLSLITFSVSASDNLDVWDNKMLSDDKEMKSVCQHSDDDDGHEEWQQNFFIDKTVISKPFFLMVKNIRGNMTINSHDSENPPILSISGTIPETRFLPPKLTKNHLILKTKKSKHTKEDDHQLAIGLMLPKAMATLNVFANNSTISLTQSDISSMMLMGSRNSLTVEKTALVQLSLKGHHNSLDIRKTSDIEDSPIFSALNLCGNNNQLDIEFAQIAYITGHFNRGQIGSLSDLIQTGQGNTIIDPTKSELHKKLGAQTQQILEAPGLVKRKLQFTPQPKAIS